MTDYVKQTWNNDDPATPLSAARLNAIETGVDLAHSELDTHAADLTLHSSGRSLGYVESQVNTTAANGAGAVTITGLEFTIVHGVRPVYISLMGWTWYTTGAASVVTFDIYDVTGAAVIAQGGTGSQLGNFMTFPSVGRRVNPAAGSRTYRARATCGQAGATATIAGSATAPAVLHAVEC